VQLWFSNEKKAKEPMCINHYHYDICGELKQMYLYREYYPEFDEKSHYSSVHLTQVIEMQISFALWFLV
jgi:hypothetical protein